MGNNSKHIPPAAIAAIAGAFTLGAAPAFAEHYVDWAPVLSYQFNGREYVTRLPYDPGERVRLRVNVAIDSGPPG